MDIPPFRMYFPTVKLMSHRQRDFYENLESRLDAGEAPVVAGNISYLFVYAYRVLRDCVTKGYSATHARLLELAELYLNEAKFAEYCKHWAYDCVLATEQYERYLEVTEPTRLFGGGTHYSNLRLNIQLHTGRAANAIDLVTLVPVQYTRSTKNYKGRFRDIVIDLFEDVAQTETAWFGRMLKELGTAPQRYAHGLFAGDTNHEAKLKFETFCLYSLNKTAERIRLAARQAENNLRDELGDPRVGEGWIAETELYRAIVSAFSNTEVIQHGRPEWLGRQHFDVWMPRWNIAVERHGRQHFEPIEYFGGEKALSSTQERDRRKENLATLHGVTLLVVSDTHSHEETIEMIRVARRAQFGTA